MENNKRVYLRALEPEDYKRSVAWRNDDEIWGMLGGRKYFVSEAYEQKWINDAIFKGGDVRLAVCDTESNLYIGNVYLTDIDYVNRTAESHVLIGDRDYWGKGLATEAYMLLLDYAFNELNLNRIEALVLENNIRSLNMHKKCGYVEEGIKRNSVYKNGKYINQIIMAVLKEEISRNRLRIKTTGRL